MSPSQFESAEDADKAPSNLRNHRILGRPMEVLNVTWPGEDAPPGKFKQESTPI
jgi:hypothetical protein